MYNNIGNTPLILSDYLSERYGCRVYIKEDFRNPGASSKDRIAWYMIHYAEKSGQIKPGGTIVEASSGNTAIGLAMLCRLKGYHCRIYLSKSGGEEKEAVLKSLGAEVIRCKTSGGPDDPQSSQFLAAEYAKETPNAFYCNQYFNEANKQAHFETTGPEIWKQTNGKISHFLAGAGTGGTVSGVGKFLKSQNRNIQISAVDPVGSVLTHYFKHGTTEGFIPQPYFIEGIGRNFIPGALDNHQIDQFVQVSGQKSAEAAFRFRNHTGMAPGFSSGAVLAALHDIRHSLKKEDHVVVFFADKGDRYSGKLYNPEWLETNLFSAKDWPSFFNRYYNPAVTHA